MAMYFGDEMAALETLEPLRGQEGKVMFLIWSEPCA
jgi:hypothetical protein